MDQTATTDLISEQDISAAGPRPSAPTPAVAIMEEGESLSGEFHHVFDYLGIRAIRIGSVAELRATLGEDSPMAVIWELAAGFDSGEVLHALYDLDRDLPVMMVAEDNGRTLALMDSMIRFWRIRGVVKLTRPPQLRELVEFMFRAGRRSGEFRVLSV